MSVRFLTLVRRIDKKKAGLTVASTCMLYALADHANDDGWSFAGQDRLGLETCMGARHVRRSLEELRDAGVLDWSRASRTAPNVYRLLVEALSDLPAIPTTGSIGPVASGPMCPVEPEPSGPRRPVVEAPSGPIEPVADASSGRGGPVRPDAEVRISISEASERERPATGSIGPVAGRTETHPGADERPVRATDPLPAELRRAAELLQVQDVNGAWLKFCGHHAGRVIHVAGQWQKWCVQEAKRERTERERSRRYGATATPEETPAQREARLQREREAQRRADAEHERLRQEAVPMPPGTLEAISGSSRTPRAAGGAGR